jgi:hypothetical protein
MLEVDFCLTGMACNGGSWFCPDFNSLDWSKLFFAKLEWLRMEKVNFGLAGAA